MINRQTVLVSMNWPIGVREECVELLSLLSAGKEEKVVGSEW